MSNHATRGTLWASQRGRLTELDEECDKIGPFPPSCMRLSMRSTGTALRSSSIMLFFVAKHCQEHELRNNALREKMGLSSKSSIGFHGAFLFILFSSIAPSAFGNETPSAYEVLQDNDFPAGLLPKGVTGYELNTQTGEFSAYFNGSCIFSLENSYQLKYESTINGVISKDRLKNLKGVSVKVLLLWLEIVEVVRDGDELQFSVGVASADFPVENFVECPQCGRGLDCDKSTDFVSSL